MSKALGVKSLLAMTAAAVMFSPSPALAQDSSTATLEARIQALEEALAAVRGELEAVRAQEQEMRDDVIRLRDAPAASAPQGPAPPREGFQVGRTTFRISGFLKADTLMTDFADGEAPAGTARDFYIPSQTPIGGVAEDDMTLEFHAKQTRIALTASRQVDGHTLSGYLETDFQSAPGTQGSQSVTNAYNLALRRAYITYDNWLFGQDWTTFQNVGALPETTDFIGPTDGTVFGRQGMVRYSHALGPHSQIQVALENPETTVQTLGAADDDTLPDAVLRVNYAPGQHQFTLAGIVRQLNAEIGALNDDAVGWGVSASGKIAFGPNNDIRFMLSGGEGIGRYLALGFAPDAAVIGGGTQLEPVPVLSGFVSYRHAWSPQWRSTLSYAMIDVDQGGLPSTASESSWSASANLFFAPADGLVFGLEYRHAERELFSGAEGSMDRLHFVAKQNF